MPLEDFKEPNIFEKLELEENLNKSKKTSKLLSCFVYWIGILFFAANIFTFVYTGHRLKQGYTPAQIEYNVETASKTDFRVRIACSITKQGRGLAYKLHQP